MVSDALQVDHMTQHMEASERSLQDRVQRLEAIRIALEEVRMGALGALECSGSAGEGCHGCFLDSSNDDLCKDCNVLWRGTEDSNWGIQFIG